MEEFTVFISVKIDNLKEFSNSMPLKVSKLLKKNNENIKIIKDKKYLWTSFNSNDCLENKCLFIKIFFGLL